MISGQQFTSKLPGGYEAKLIDDIQKRHECAICLLPMRSPYQTECGHLFCKSCLEPLFRRRNPLCPIDQEVITREGTFPDNACRREILALKVYCNFNMSGCSWTGVLANLEAHTEECLYREVQCMQCGRYVQALALEKHKTVECAMRPSSCPHCHHQVPAEQMKAHIEKVCPQVLHLCPNKCSSQLQMKLDELNNHLATKGGTCPLSEVCCPYHQLGCTFKGLRKDLPEHMQVNLIEHSELLTENAVEIKREQDIHALQLQQIVDRIAAIETRLSAAEKRTDAVEQRIDTLSERKETFSERYNSRIGTLEEKVGKMQVSLIENQRQTEAAPGYSFSSSMSPLGYPALTSNPVGYSGVLSTLTGPSVGASTAYSSALGQRVDGLYSKLAELDHTVSSCLSRSLDQDVRLQLLEHASYDGTMVWKIDDFERRRKEAMDGINLSIYSSPFYTSRHGYKVCARLYLNGDGMGKNSHLSFFFVIMKGRYDALLSWPFQQKVTLVLFHPTSPKRNVMDSFKPDPHSTSFQRPLQREMNIASGCPMFCRLDQVVSAGHVQDDCIYVGVTIETASIPKLLPGGR